jgi:hypothetical protein
MVGLTSKSTSWGSGVEVMGIGFVTYTLMPWEIRWEQSITRDLILAPQKYFVEFLNDALLRGDTKSRYDAYNIAAGGQAPWMSRNEIRQRENMNPIPGLDGILQPLNMSEVGQLEAIPAPTIDNAHYEQLLYEAAGRVIRKEKAAMTKAAKKGGDWIQAVEDFYITHAEFVAQTLRISIERAGQWVQAQMAELQYGPDMMADWETRRVADLVALVKEVL